MTTIGKLAATESRVTVLEKRLKEAEARLEANQKLAKQIHFYLKKTRDAVLATDGTPGPISTALHEVAKQSGQMATGD